MYFKVGIFLWNAWNFVPEEKLFQHNTKFETDKKKQKQPPPSPAKKTQYTQPTEQSPPF